jgi:hypothetical protein
MALEAVTAATITADAVIGAKAGLDIVISKLMASRIELESGVLVPILSDSDFGSPEVIATFVNGRTLSPLHTFTELLIGTSTLT